MNKVCKYLKENIDFYDNRIVCCGQNFLGNIENAKEYFTGFEAGKYKNDFSINEYSQKRQEYLNIFKEGKSPSFCNDCNMYVPTLNSESFSSNYKFKRINIAHETICNCQCVYCCIADEGNLERFKELNAQKNYDIMPILNQIAEQKLIDNKTTIGIFGGECTLYPQELNNIISFGEKYNCNLEIYSNGIIYNEAIEKLMKNNKIRLTFSIDCGSKKLFSKIKRVDKFDKVIENIKKYKDAAKGNPNAFLQLKYIICPGYNDNINEMKKFFELALNCRADQVILSINRFWMDKNKFKPIPKSIKQVIKYFIQNRKYNIIRSIYYCELWPWWLEKALKETESKSVFNFLLTKLNIIKN